jgi:hypothetical protein
MSRLSKTFVAVLSAAALTVPAAQAQVQHFASPPPPPASDAATVSTPQLLKQARRAFAGRSATDLTPLLRELAARLPSLKGSERRDARALLARPSDGPADPQGSGYTVPEAPASPSCSAHFCVHWVATSDDAPDLADNNANGIPDFVETTTTAAETSHSVENDQLGWREPKSDGTEGGSVGKVDIYLKQLGGTGIYGYSAPDPSQPNEGDNSLYAYLVLDNDFQKSEFPQYESPTTPLEVTLAHEYNHVLQFGIDFNQDTWMFESTAVWMEGKVFPAAFDYLQYLPGWVQLTAKPLTSFNGTNPNDRGNVKVYGSSVWNKWLDARYGPNVIRNAWESSLVTKPASFAVAAYDRAIRGSEGGVGFGAEFDRFAAATAEWQAANSGFPEGALYPDVTRAGSASVNGTGGTVSLNHTTYALIDVRPTSAARIKLGMTMPAGTQGALALVGRAGEATGGESTVVLKVLSKGGLGSVTVDDPSRFSRLTAVLINSDAKTSGSAPLTRDWTYAHDKQPFYARVSTDFKAPHVVRVSPAAGAGGVSRRARIKVVFSEPVVGVTAKSLRLIASNGRTVKSKLSFKSGTKTATLTPSAGLGRARRYRVRVSRAVADTAVNPLARAIVTAFGTAG